ncbi:aromatic-L-amino-acid decarboxylase-like [Cimex lectularius]|uniref:Aromatic-L-amino-acid decarboxylase n=1 Tax=Cimex lectularius TaxID=79782 RepID=A0A8I6S8G0_CIMLE|nr:aromatic-L-amino-acid decarboxylase-like [Cimex lectularius]
MDPKEFKKFAKEAIDYVVEYNENIRDRTVLPDISPGYLHTLLPEEVPKHPEHWTEIIPDIERFIMPGITHWNSPMFNAYFPAGQSYPSIVGDILSSGIGCIGFNWMTSPACTELEVIVLDWLAKLMHLPEHFLAKSKGPGGGIIQGSGSEGILVALIIAKDKMVKMVKKNHPDWDEELIKTKLVAYSSDQSNSSIEKAGLLGSMKTRLIPSDEHGRLDGNSLKAAFLEDKKKGLLPCFVVATLGTTGTCAFDNLNEIGPICQNEHVWLHVDAAYAGAAFICPEYTYLMGGVEYADSFNMNPHKWLLINFDCSAFWIKDRNCLIDAFCVDRIYLQEKCNTDKKWCPDFRNWEISLGRRFRALKLWLTLRLYGTLNLQAYIRKHISLAKQFELYVKQDSRFELITPASMGLVCFRIKGEDKITKDLVTALINKKRIYVNAATFKDKYFIRYAICSRYMEQEDVQLAWKMITTEASLILAKKEIKLDEFIAHDKNENNLWGKVLEESLVPYLI